jgi:hypothetical protein
MIDMEQLLESLAMKTDLHREEILQPLYAHHNPTWPEPVSNPGCLCGKPANNLLSYGSI